MQILRLKKLPAVTAGLRVQTILANATHEYSSLVSLRAALAASQRKAEAYRQAENSAVEVR